MEFKIIIYLIGAVIYIVYKRYQKLQKEAIKRQEQLQGDIPPVVEPVKVMPQKPLQRVKDERQQMYVENSRVREQNKLRSTKIVKPFFEKPEHVISVFKNVDLSTSGITTTSATTVSDDNYVLEEIDIRKMILYSELLKRPAW